MIQVPHPSIRRENLTFKLGIRTGHFGQPNILVALTIFYSLFPIRQILSSLTSDVVGVPQLADLMSLQSRDKTIQDEITGR